tara:strand:- start:1306 stop:8871 length:7566 start_codon:yes stop_codon:yes gene_type:complete
MQVLSIDLRDVFLKTFEGASSKPKASDLTYNSLVSNTEFGIKIDKLTTLLRYYDKELNKTGNHNGFSYSQKASSLREFTNKLIQEIKEYAVEGQVEDINISYEGSIGIDSPKKEAFNVLAVSVSVSSLTNPIELPLLDPVVAGYLVRLDEVSRIADPIYIDRNKKKHPCETQDGTGVIGIINTQRRLGEVKSPPYYDWYTFSRRYNARPYCDTLGPTRKEAAVIDKAPDKFKKRSSFGDLKWYSDQINDSGEEMLGGIVDLWNSFEYVGDEFFSEESLKSLVKEISDIEDLYTKVLHKVCPANLISKVIECNLGTTDCRELIKMYGVTSLMPVMKALSASDSKYVEMIEAIEQINSNYNTTVVRLDKGNTISIEVDDKIEQMYKNEFSVSINVAASYFKNQPGTILASHSGDKKAWLIKTAESGKLVVEVYYDIKKVSLTTKTPIITNKDSEFIHFGFSYRDGQVEAYSLEQKIDLIMTPDERGVTSRVPASDIQKVGEGTSDVNIVIGGDDAGNSVFQGSVDNFKMYSKAKQGFPQEDLGISEENTDKDGLVIWLRMGDDLRDRIDKTNRDTESNRIYNQIEQTQALSEFKEYYGTPLGFKFDKIVIPGFENGLVVASAMPQDAPDIIVAEIEKYIDINAFCTVLIRHLLEVFGFSFPTFETPRVQLIRPFGNFYFQINKAVAMAIFQVLSKTFLNLIDKLIDCNILNAKNAADLMAGVIEGHLDEIAASAGKGISQELEDAVKKLAPLLEQLATIGVTLGAESATTGGPQITDTFDLSLDTGLNMRTKARSTSAFSHIEDEMNKYSDIDVVRQSGAILSAEVDLKDTFIDNTSSSQDSILLMQSMSSISQALEPHESMSLLVGEASLETAEKARLALPERLKNLFDGKLEILASSLGLVGHIAGLGQIKQEVLSSAEKQYSEESSFDSCNTQMDIRKKILEESFVRGSISKEEMTRQIQEMDEERTMALREAISAAQSMNINFAAELQKEFQPVEKPQIVNTIGKKVFSKILDPIKISFDKDMKLYKAAMAKKKIHEKKIPKILYKGEDIRFNTLEGNKFTNNIGEIQKTMVNPEFQALLSTGYIPMLEDNVTVDGTPEGGFLARDEELEYIDESRIYKKHEFVTVDPPGGDNSYPDPGRFRDAESVGPYTDFDNPIAIRKFETNILMGNLRDHLKKDRMTKNFFSGRETDAGAFKALTNENEIIIDGAEITRGFANAAIGSTQTVPETDSTSFERESQIDIADDIEEEIKGTVVRILRANGFVQLLNLPDGRTPATSIDGFSEAVTERLTGGRMVGSFSASSWEGSTYQLLNSVSDLHEATVAMANKINKRGETPSADRAYAQLALITSRLQRKYKELVYSSPEDYLEVTENIVANSSFYGLRGQTSDTVLTDVAATNGYIDPALQNDFSVRFADEFSNGFENKTKLFLEKFGRTPYSAGAEISNNLAEELKNILVEYDDENALDCPAASKYNSVKLTSQERAFNILMKKFWKKVIKSEAGDNQENPAGVSNFYEKNIQNKMVQANFDKATDSESSVFDRITREVFSFLTDQISTNSLIREIAHTENSDTGESLIGAHFINFNPTQSPAHKKAKADPRIFNFDSIYDLAVSLFSHLDSQPTAGVNVDADKNVDTPMSITLETISALMLVRVYCIEYILQAIIPILHYNKPMDELTKEIIMKRMITDMDKTFDMTPKIAKAVIKANNNMVESSFIYPMRGTRAGSYYDFSNRAVVQSDKQGFVTVLKYLIEKEYEQVTTKLKQNINNVCEVSNVTEEEQKVKNLALRENFVKSLEVLSVGKNRFANLDREEGSRGKIILEKYVKDADGKVLTSLRRFRLEGEPSPDLTMYDFEWDNEEHILSQDVATYGVRISYVELLESPSEINRYGISENDFAGAELDNSILNDIDFEKIEEAEKAHVQDILGEQGNKVGQIYVNVLCSYEEDRASMMQNIGVDPTDPCDLEQFYERNTTRELQTTTALLSFDYPYVSTDTSLSNFSMPDPDFTDIKRRTFIITPHRHNAVSLEKPTDLGYSSDPVTVSVMEHNRSTSRAASRDALQGSLSQDNIGTGQDTEDIQYISYDSAVKGTHYHDIRGPELIPSEASYEVNVWLHRADILRGDAKDPTNWPTEMLGFAMKFDNLSVSMVEDPGILTDKSLLFFNKTEEEVEQMIEEHNSNYPSTLGSSGNEMNMMRDRIENYILIKQKRTHRHTHTYTEQVPLDFDPRVSDRIFEHLRDKLSTTPEFRIMFDFSFDLDKFTTLISNYSFLANTSLEFEQMFSQTKFNTAMLTAIGNELSDYSKSYEECNASQASRDFELPAFTWNSDLLLFMLKTPLQVYKGWSKTADPHTLITQTIVELFKLGYIVPKMEEKIFEVPNTNPPECITVPGFPTYPGIQVDFPGLTQVTALGVTYAPLIVGAPPFIPTPFGLIYYAVVDPLLFLLDGISSTNVMENIDLKSALEDAGIYMKIDGSCVICDEDGEVPEDADEETEDDTFALCKTDKKKSFDVLNMSKFGKVRGC